MLTSSDFCSSVRDIAGGHDYVASNLDRFYGQRLTNTKFAYEIVIREEMNQYKKCGM